jgi:hypothetical protein
MIFSSIAAHDQDDIGVSDIYPVICHCTASERLCQSRNCCGVSDTGLVLYVDKSKGTKPLLKDIALFIVKGCASDTGNTVTAVDDLAFCIFFNKGFIS